ncbi:hypothetical protein [Metallosphaera hakonensis]|uniref:hypothetical protein n=1 Tax=Metallosphaera hakonensis TaxID=79601 RepID=UPI0006D06622|nr:hypothetical protein [Metallosphaera hakonensis]
MRAVVLEAEASFFNSIQGVMTRTLKLKAFPLFPRRKVEVYVLLGPATNATVTLYDVKIKVGGREVKGMTSISQFSADKYTIGCSLSKELEEEVPSHSLMTMEMMVQAFVDLVKDKERVLEILEEQRERKLHDGYRTHPLNPIYRLKLKTEYVGYRIVEPA